MATSQVPGLLEGGKLAVSSFCVFVLPVATTLAGAVLFPSGGLGGLSGFAAGVVLAKIIVKLLQCRGGYLCSENSGKAGE